jgi:hypothetical protein
MINGIEYLAVANEQVACPAKMQTRPTKGWAISSSSSPMPRNSEPAAAL